jgi:hypothetical protein
MKKLLFIFTLFCFSCKKEAALPATNNIKIKPLVSDVKSVLASNNAGYNLYIPEDEGGWDNSYQSGRVGLYNGFKSISHTTVNSYLYKQYGEKVPLGSQIKVCYYDCLIANGVQGEAWDTTENNPITRSGAQDYIVQGGIQQIPLTITTYADGDVYMGRKKDEFYYTPTDRRLNAANGINHHGDTSFIWWGWGDNYNNTAIIPETDGLYVIAVSMDYGTNPTTSLLPIRVSGNEVVTDTTAIVANSALPASNIQATLQKGKYKGVNITWEGNAYAYCIERDGQMIAVWQDIRTFFDHNGNKNSVYRIISRNQGRIRDAYSNYFKPIR